MPYNKKNAFAISTYYFQPFSKQGGSFGVTKRWKAEVGFRTEETGFFFCSTWSRPALGPTQGLIEWVAVGYFTGSKVAEV
jgi:hypothetical protein